MAEKKRIESVRDRYSGEEIWILGTGLDFSDFPLDFFNDKIVIAMRPTYAEHLFPNCTFNFCSYTDSWAVHVLPEMVEKNPEILERQIFTLEPKSDSRPGAYQTRSDAWLGERINTPCFMPTLKWFSFSDSYGMNVQRKHIEDTVRNIMQKKSCSYCGDGRIQGWAIEAALVLGAKKITLAGCGCQPGKDRYHSKKLDFFYASKWQAPRVDVPDFRPPKSDWSPAMLLLVKMRCDIMRKGQQEFKEILKPYGVELRRFFYKTGYQQIES